MINQKIIPKSKFIDAFTKAGWKQSSSQNHKYLIFTSPSDSSIWTVVPNDDQSQEYLYYQIKNIKTLVYAFGLEYSDINAEEIKSQLTNYNYKLINRIESNNLEINGSVPYELATNLPGKNVSAFRTYYQIKTKGKQTLPIENFKLHHTQKGSFVIPVSVVIEETQDKLPTIASEANQLIKEYLNQVDELLSIQPENIEQYVNAVIERDIDSKLVKDFLSATDSIAKYKKKYEENIKEITISARSNPILDFSLPVADKSFKTVDLSRIETLDQSYIDYLEEKEIELDSTAINEKNVRIQAIVDGLERGGKAKFRVISVNGEPFKKAFQARTTQLPEMKLNLCAEAFKSADPIVITGDISKKKRSVANIVVDDMKLSAKEKTLFSDTENN